MQIANGAESVLVASCAIVDHGAGAVWLGAPPILKVVGEFIVGDDIGMVDAPNGLAAVEHVLEHGPAAYGQERFGGVLGEGIQPRGVTGGKDDLFHGEFRARYGKCPAQPAVQGRGIVRARPHWIRIVALAGRVPEFRCILTVE